MAATCLGLQTRMHRQSSRYLVAAVRNITAMTERCLHRPVHLVLDFDGTFTVKDTLALLARATYQRDVRTGRFYPPSRSLSTKPSFDPGPQWVSFVQAYVADYENLQQAQWSLDDGCTASQLSTRLASLEQVEKASLERVQTAKFFQHVTYDDIEKAVEEAAQHELFSARVGWYNLFDLFMPRVQLDSWQRDLVERSTISILSVNWSATFVRLIMIAALVRHVRLERSGSMDDEMLHFIRRRMQVVANELDALHTSSGSSGRIIGGVHTNLDKLRHLPPARLKVDACHPERHPSKSKPSLVYVGDSPTDFDCLQAADIGIWLHPTSVAARDDWIKTYEAKFHQVDVVPIDIRKGSASTAPSDTFMCAGGLDEIVTYLTGLDEIHA